MKLGIMGGTFNPIHQAHLRIAEVAREAAGLEQVLFIPAMDPPHKAVGGAIPFPARFKMTALAIADNPGFAISDCEARRPGKSYTVETLAALRHERPNDEPYLIIGSDSFLELGLWHRYAELFELASLVVVARPGSLVTDLHRQLPEAVRPLFARDSGQRLRHSSGTTVHFVEDSPLEISSSNLRSLAAAGRSLRYLVPPAVETYIAQKGLYRT